MPHTGGGRWNCRLLKAPLGQRRSDSAAPSFCLFVSNSEGNCWPLLASPDHSPLTPLCNSQNIPLVIIIPTKKKQTEPCFPFDFLTVVCHCWLSPSLLFFFFLALDRHEIFSLCVLPLLRLSPTLCCRSPTHHPFLIGPHYRLLSVSRRQVGRSRRSLSCLKTFAFVVGCSSWRYPNLW